MKKKRYYIFNPKGQVSTGMKLSNNIIKDNIYLYKIYSKITDDLYENEIFYQAYTFLDNGKNKIKIDLIGNKEDK